MASVSDDVRRMSEHEHTEPQPDEREAEVEDLDVPEGREEDLGGEGAKIEIEDGGE
jgi:hypothetical protein